MNQKIIEDLNDKVISAAMTVHTSIGYGLREKTYERSLCVELDHVGIHYNQQSIYPVL